MTNRCVGHAAAKPTADPLKQRLRGLSKPRYRDHDGRVGRMVAWYREGRGRRDSVGTGPVPLGDVRLVVLSYRWGVGWHGEPRPRVPLATYRPVLDVSGGFRVRWECEGVEDASRPGLGSTDPNTCWSAAWLHESGEDAEQWEWSSDLALPRLYAAFAPGRAACAAWSSWAESESASELSVEGLRAWPLERYTRPSGPMPPSSVPAAVYAELSHLRGRRVRNPAYWLLRDLGVIGATDDYAAWSRSRTPARSEAIRSALAARVGSVADGELALRLALEASCARSGVPLPGGAWGDAATGLLHAPWGWVEAPSRGRSLPIALSGPPGPATARFATDGVEADLGSLEGYGPRYRPLARGVVAASLAASSRHAGSRRRRGGRPD